MKHFVKTLTLTLALGIITSFGFQASANNNKGAEEQLTHFPQAELGMVRHVIILPKKNNEANYKVEIIPGKTMSVDCNNHRLIGNLSEEDLTGWGYTYFVYSSDGLTRSTMMMCNEPNTTKFVSGQTSIIDYNSKLPIVIYAPKGFDIKYRIWEAGKEKLSVEK